MQRTSINCVLVADDSDGSGLQLEKISQFSQVLPVHLREVPKNDYGLFFLEEKLQYFLRCVVRAISC